MDITRPQVSVIIPTYNESGNIALLISKIKQRLQQISHEIIVVDDNSPDGTWEIVENISYTDPMVRVIRRVNDRGLSSAVITGMGVAGGETFAVIDADLQHDESILPEMVRLVRENQCDVAIGSRGIEGGSYGEWSRKRRFISWVAATMARTVLPVQVKDPMSGYFVITREFFQKSAHKINPRGFKILLEFIGRNQDARIKEVGYTFQNRIHGETKLSGSVIKNYLVALYDLKFGKFISPTFMLYSLVGASGVFVNMGGFFLGEVMGLPKINTGLSEHFDPLYLSVPFGIQISIISNYFLNNFITFYERRHRGMANVRGLVIFQIVSLLGLVVQMGVFQLLQNNGFPGILAATDSLRKYINNAIAILVAMVSNFYLNVNFTWKK